MARAKVPKVKRYSFVIEEYRNKKGDYCGHDETMREDPNGDWVRYSDLLRAIERGEVKVEKVKP